jgi:hypothetical protein
MQSAEARRDRHTLNKKPGYRLGAASMCCSKNRRSMVAGIVVSLLLHVLALWLVLDNDTPIDKPLQVNAERRIAVSLVEPSASKVSDPPEPRQPIQPAQKKTLPADAKKRQRVKPTATADKQAALPSKSVPAAPSPERVRPDMALTDDLFSQLEAARKRRAEAAIQSGLPELASEPEQPEQADNDQSVALANIEFSLRRARGTDREDVGGVFQVRRVGYQDAEFVFRGWSERSRRNATRLINVEKGPNADIQTALIKKVIEIIREEKKGDFLWESKRLGKSITLSARLQDNNELEQFLMREFFPEYHPAVSKG